MTVASRCTSIICITLPLPPVLHCPVYPLQVLQKGDVLMEFDGVPIANDGTVHFRARERIFFTSLITLKPTGSTAHVKVGFGVQV